nr:hypothetical protein [Escherichia coli]
MWVITVNKVRPQNDQQNSIQLLNCCGKADYDITGIFTRMDERATLAVYPSQRRWTQLTALFSFRVSIPSSASTSNPRRCDDSRMEALI